MRFCLNVITNGKLMASEYDFKDPRWRGILTIVAKKHGVTRDAVSKSILRGSTKYINEVIEEIEKRQNAINKLKKLMSK